MKRARTLYVERLRLRHLPIVTLASRAGFDVAAFDLDRDLKQERRFRELIDAGRLRLIAWQPMRGAERAAIEAADRIVDGMADAPAVRALERLTGTEEVRLVVKRALAEQLSSMAFVHQRIAAEAARRPLVIVDRLLVTQRLMARAGVPWFDLPPGTLTIGTANGGRLREVWRATAGWTRTVVRVASKLLTQVVPGRRRPERTSAAIGVAVSIPFLLKFKGPRAYDFLIGGDLSADDVAFLVEFPPPPGFVDAERERGRRVVDVSRLASLAGMRRSAVGGAWVRRLWRALVRLTWTAPASGFVSEAAAAVVHAEVQWNVLLQHLDVRAYVFTNKEDKVQIAANIVLRRAGVATWNYSLFVGGPYQVDVPQSGLDDRNVLWSFLNSDHWALNNDAMRRSFDAHPHAVRAHDVIGNIFGELVAELRRGDLAVVRAGLGLPPQARGRTIAVFDTSYIEQPFALAAYDDAIGFLRDVIRLVSDLADEDRLVFKPSKPESWYVDPAFVWSSPEKGRVVVSLQRELAADARVVWLGDDADTTEVCAVADLTITHCFSSPTADALSAGAAAVWYEHGDRLRGYPLDRIPGAVLHGYDELLAAVRAVEPGAPAPPPDGPEMRDMVDPFLDGRALTRLRRLLNEG